MSNVITIYKLTDKAVKMTKADKVAMERRLAVSRVNREAIVELFVSGQFNSLPTLPMEYRNSPALRTLDKIPASHGFIVPEASVGRKGVSQSQANSIRLWITKNLNVDPAVFGIMVDTIA